MAGIVSSFVNGSQLEIQLGDRVLAYAQGLSFNEDMTVVPVGGIGSHSHHALEPTQYIASGSMIVTRYSDKILGADGKPIPDIQKPGVKAPKGVKRDGNSLLISSQFSPHTLIYAPTVDIKVFSRTSGSQDNKDKELLYTLRDCRFTGYSFSFTPGSLMQEVVTFLCIEVEDHVIK